MKNDTISILPCGTMAPGSRLMRRVEQLIACRAEAKARGDQATVLAMENEARQMGLTVNAA